VVEVAAVGLLAEHLRPVGDVLCILMVADDKIVAFQGEVSVNPVGHDTSVMFQKLALDVVVEEYSTFWPGVIVK
jgi:hypothetical protein